jgi:hypothetical protein
MENPSNTFKFRITAGGTDTSISDTSAHLLNRWYHVVGTYNGATMKIYVDGVLKNSKAQTGTLATNSVTAKIGTFQGTNYNFTGRINDVRVYNHTLSEYEVKELAKAKVTHLPLDGHSLDIAGYLYNGTPQASTSYTTDSKIYSQAFQNTDGGGSKAITIENGTQNITGDQTIAMWLFPTSFAARRNPWNKAYGGEGTITQETNGVLNYFWGTNGGNSTPYQGFTSGVLTLNTWNHIAIVRDLSGTTPQLRWYINGALSTTATPSYTAATATTNGTTIGAGYTSPYHGRISDVRQYGTALTVTDILALYNRRANFDNLGNVSAGEFLEYTNYDSFIQQNNLVYNGLGELGNNTNFSNFVYQPSFSGFSRTSGSTTVFQDDLIPVRGNGLNSFNRYTISAEFRQLTGTASRYYFMIVCYDVNKNFIEHRMVANYSNTRTTLAQPLNNGDTIVHLTSAANWIAGTAGTTAFNKHIAVFNSPLYPIYTYTRLTRNFITVNTANNTITLQAAWNGGTIPAGTAVANAFDGGTFSYIGASNPLTTTSFVLRQGTSSSSASTGSMRYGSEYIRVGFLLNRDAGGTVTTDIRNIRCWNIDDPTQGFFLSTNKNMISDSSQASYTDIDEVTGTLNTNAQQEINRNGTLFINGEFSEVD